jgi:DNA-binding IclR family transcriptional regulator
MTQDLVKSAARAMEILELFAVERRRLNSAFLATRLGYPKSSLSVLLKSLVAQGYLAMGGDDQDYFPTMKLARLGEWVPAALLGSQALIPLLEQLRDRTSETVTLTIASDFQMRVVHTLVGTHPIAFQVEDGVSFPMVGSAIGSMYLATQTETAVKARLAAWAKLHPDKLGMLPEVETAIAHARTDGAIAVYDSVVPDAGAIAVPIRRHSDGEVMVVALAGLNHRIRAREPELISVMHDIFDRLPEL